MTAGEQLLILIVIGVFVLMICVDTFARREQHEALRAQRRAERERYMNEVRRQP